jgi:hypothetical protein
MQFFKNERPIRSILGGKIIVSKNIQASKK